MIFLHDFVDNTSYTRELMHKKKFLRKQWTSVYAESSDSLDKSYFYKILMNDLKDTVIIEKRLNQTSKKKYNSKGQIMSIVENKRQPSSRLDIDTILFYYNDKDQIDSIISYVDTHNGTLFLDTETIEYKSIEKKMVYFSYYDNKLSTIKRFYKLKSDRVVDIGSSCIQYMYSEILFANCTTKEVYKIIIFANNRYKK